MKKSIQLFALITLIFSSLTINAQSKVAHIDVQKLITEMPEVITAQKELEKLQKTYTTDIQNTNSKTSSLVSYFFYELATNYP